MRLHFWHRWSRWTMTRTYRYVRLRDGSAARLYRPVKQRHCVTCGKMRQEEM